MPLNFITSKMPINFTMPSKSAESVKLLNLNKCHILDLYKYGALDIYKSNAFELYNKILPEALKVH